MQFFKISCFVYGITKHEDLRREKQFSNALYSKYSTGIKHYLKGAKSIKSKDMNTATVK